MGSTKEDQAARRKAMQDVIAANRGMFEDRMRHHYEEMGLGEWTPRLSPAERAERKAHEERAKNEEKIRLLAERSGISLTIHGDDETDEPIPLPN